MTPNELRKQFKNEKFNYFKKNGNSLKWFDGLWHEVINRYEAKGQELYIYFNR